MCFVFFTLLAIWNPAIFLVLFGVAYIPSLIMALWTTYMSRNALESIPNIVNENLKEATINIELIIKEKI